MVLAPYVIAAPLIFAEDPGRRITLGTLMKMSNSFEKVFGSLSVIAENWGAINDFRSTYRRLREFESKLYVKSRVGRGLLPAEVVHSTELSRPDSATAQPVSSLPADVPVVDGIDPTSEPTPRERGRRSERDSRFVPIHISGPDTDPELRV